MARCARLLSGGKQQMLTLGRALERGTALLLADELSLGAGAEDGGALLVEQHGHRVLGIVDRVYLLGQGRIQFRGTPTKRARTSTRSRLSTSLLPKPHPPERVPGPFHVAMR
jgi:ABC-type branched-subunit amino acid transport system ATPase component